MIKPSDLGHIDKYTPKQLPTGTFPDFTENQTTALGKLNSTVETVFEPLQQNQTVHFITCGHWSTHELLFWILNQIGPAHVTIGVWSMGEDAARKLINLMDKKVILSLRAVLDYRSKNRHAAAHQLACHSFSEVRTFPFHAKLTVVKNDKWTVLINGSPNYTNNPRPEAGYVSTIPDLGDFYLQHIESILNKANPFA